MKMESTWQPGGATVGSRELGMQISTMGLKIDVIGNNDVVNDVW